MGGEATGGEEGEEEEGVTEFAARVTEFGAAQLEPNLGSQCPVLPVMWS